MSDPFFQPIAGNDLPRFAGVPSFMRLPVLGFDHPRIGAVDVGLIGVPWDGGTTNRPGARHGPRQLRDASTMIRRRNPATGVDPFAAMACADLGDVSPNPVSLPDTLARISAFYAEIQGLGIRPMSVGGDHLITLPILRGLVSEPVGLIQFDAHTDLGDSYFGGERFTHGTPFRRAIEEGLLDPKRVVQIGIRGTQYDTEDLEFARSVGVRIIPVEAVFERGIADVMAEARAIVGAAPAYVSFDIDFLDPSVAPGTGTPEIGGPFAHQAQAAIRGLEGVSILGADLVEVSPPFDPGGGTAWLGISLVFELMCVMAPKG